MRPARLRKALASMNTFGYGYLDYVPSGVAILEGNLEVVFWNRTLESWTQINRSDIIGKQIFSFFPHLKNPKYSLRFRNVIAGGPPAIFSSQIHKALLPCKLPDGRERVQHCVVTAKPRDNGEGFQAMISVQDVTDLTNSIGTYRATRLRLEKEMNERERAQKALLQSERIAAVGTLAAGIAHNFNNLNAGIMGHLDLMRRQGGLPEKQAKRLDMIMNTIKRSIKLTDSLMVFAGRRRGKWTVCNLAEILSDTISLIRNEYESDGISIDTGLNGPLCLSCSPGEISHVFFNLLVNARHAMINAPVKQLTVTSGIEGSRAWFRVADTGCGISADKLEAIFLPFFSTKGEHAESGSPLVHVQGSGLGLSVSDTIIKNHSGEITVQSTPGEGATFTVWLPLNLETFEESSTAPEPVNCFAGKKVLAIDDEEIIRSLVEDIITDAGCSIEVFGNARLALERMKSERFDLILVDLQMPLMNGYEFVAELNKLPADKRPPCVVVTGKIISETELVNELNVSGIVSKPFTEDQLLAVVEKALLLQASSSH